MIRRLMMAMFATAVAVSACGGPGEPSAANINARSGGELARRTAAPSPQEFADMMILDGRYEIQAAEIALARALRPETKAFARVMIGDYGNLTGDLEAALTIVAPRLRIAAGLDAARRSRLERLREVARADFDTAYLHSEHAGQQAALAAIVAYAAFGDDPALKPWAKGAKTTIEHHIDRLKRIGGAPPLLTRPAVPATQGRPSGPLVG